MLVTYVSVILHLLVIASAVLANDDPVEEIVLEVKKAGDMTTEVCSAIKEDARKISESSGVSAELSSKADALMKEAESCLSRVGEAETLMSEEAEEMGKDVQAVMKGEKGADGHLSDDVQGYQKDADEIIKEFDGYAVNMKEMAEEISGLTDSLELDEVKALADKIAKKAAKMKSKNDKTVQNIEQNVDVVENIL